MASDPCWQNVSDTTEMGLSRPSSSDDIPGTPPQSSSPSRTLALPRPTVSLIQPSHKKARGIKVFRVFRSVFRSFPILTPTCKIPALPGGGSESRRHITGGIRVTGTIFGYRKGRVSLVIQETSRCIPSLIVELAIQTNTLLREMSSGMVRIALETEKKAEKSKLLEEPLWTVFCNGKKCGYGVKREANEDDLGIMELLQPVSMGAGVLPGKPDSEGPDDELAYMRVHFDRVTGSRDSEAFYMISPDATGGPELSIFFVRV